MLKRIFPGCVTRCLADEVVLPSLYTELCSESKAVSTNREELRRKSECFKRCKDWSGSALEAVSRKPPLCHRLLMCSFLKSTLFQHSE